MTRHVIINTSMLVQLRPVSDVLAAFSRLYQRYSSSSACRCLPFSCRLFSTPSVYWRYRGQTVQELIRDYKLGIITTKAFCRGLQIALDLDEALLPLEEETTMENLISAAWNSLIGPVIQAQAAILTQLVSQPDTVVHFVGFTNEANMTLLLERLRIACPDIPWSQNVNLGRTVEVAGLELAPRRIKGHFSHQLGQEKSSRPGTPGIIESLVTHLRSRLGTHTVEIYSQFAPDRELAAHLGVARVSRDLSEACQPLVQSVSYT